jgi:hypothetical protein
MKELHFAKTGRMLIATEGPYRFVLRQTDTGWAGEIYERDGRRTPKMEARFPSKSAAIDWMGRYRAPVVACAVRERGATT